MLITHRLFSFKQKSVHISFFNIDRHFASKPCPLWSFTVFEQKSKNQRFSKNYIFLENVFGKYVSLDKKELKVESKKGRIDSLLSNFSPFGNNHNLCMQFSQSFY